MVGRLSLLMSSASLPVLKASTLNACGMGVFCGILHAVGPDHIATLVSFSTLLTPWAAAKVGAAWGLGHCAGILGVALLVYMLGNVIPMANWEKYGDYVIGASLILVAAYFFLQESQHLVADADGNIVVAGCGCAQPHPATGTHAHHHGCSDSHHAEDDCTEETPLIIQVEDVHDVKGRDTKGAIVGFVQGMCCPMGLVQLSYLAGRGALDTVVFCFVTVLVSILGTALLAAGWAALTRSELLKSISPVFMYRASCGFTLLLGILWIAANYCDILHKLNYVEGGHEMM
ncbi:hypothetical protein AK812_SmicGene8257 [Symbiodinium microadriaticum]|uniref:Nickel/cobalt efflux system n=1 Tax=Symbiodinium microadriaticum TaxID=2951 RepID=A0A1Q9ELD8_SYMMI|nr:hypothetical protein AK812_SmicGene8257 [Symbiodinium microadriaticum]